MMSESLERLEFDQPDQPYEAYLMAQHLVRYAAAKTVVQGKRVLDVACGSGYGCKLLADWGAKEVVGVDVSANAIASAERLFGGEKTRFLVGDAEDISPVIGKTKKFDVIVCFETIEHLQNPEELLKALARHRAANGIVFVSCPNDAMFKTLDMQSSFHEKTYGFEDFRALAEMHLGIADSWLLGSPVYGEMNYLADSSLIAEESPDAMSIFKFREISSALQIPSQQNTRPSAGTVSHFIGVWGLKAQESAVIIAQSVPAFVEPWRGMEFLSKENTEASQQLQTARSLASKQKDQLIFDAEQIQQSRERTLDLVATVGELQTNINNDRQRLLDLSAIVGSLQQQLQIEQTANSTLHASGDELQKLLVEQLTLIHHLNGQNDDLQRRLAEEHSKTLHLTEMNDELVQMLSVEKSQHDKVSTELSNLRQRINHSMIRFFLRET